MHQSHLYKTVIFESRLITCAITSISALKQSSVNDNHYIFYIQNQKVDWRSLSLYTYNIYELLLMTAVIINNSGYPWQK